MARVTIWLDQKLADEVRAKHLAVSTVAQAALRAELRQIALGRPRHPRRLVGVNPSEQESQCPPKSKTQ